MTEKFIVDSLIIEAAKKVTKKRPKTVIDHIIVHGHISTEELKDVYGYNHPPRAARDVREEGIPLVTFNVTGSDGRKIGAYRFGSSAEIEGHKLGGRKTFSKTLKKKLIDSNGEKCAISGEQYEARYLQIDHRIPYEIAGDDIATESDPDSFMLLTGSAQRQKSWSCEHCINFLNEKSKKTCATCYWAYPEKHSHVATENIRYLAITFKGNDAQYYDKMEKQCKENAQSPQDYLKELVRDKFSSS
ncbi:MAG: hypothetical protein ACI8WB_000028 [Phenylobacterium sp.]|jgi:hypothetical protein